MDTALRFVQVRTLLKADGKLIAVGLALALVIFAFDLYVRLGVAAGVPYVLLVLICLWARHPFSIHLMAAIGTILTVAGYFLSPEGGVNWVVLTNRGLAIFAIWAVALFSATRLHEISKRKTAEMGLSDSEARLQLIMDSVPVGICYFNEEARFSFANESYRTILNMQPKNLIGMTLKEALGKKAYSGTEKYVKRALAGEFVTFENTLPSSGAGEITVSVSYVPHRRPDGAVDGFFAVVYDITKRKEAEDAIKATAEELDRRVAERTAELEKTMTSLSESEARYRGIIETTNEGFSRIDTDLRIIEVNDALCRMLGYQRDEILGKRPFDLLSEPGNLGLEEQIVEFIRQGGESTNREIQLRKRDGSLMEARVSAKSYLDQDGNFAGRFTFITDITEQKERDGQLHQAQKMEAMGQLTGGVAHEFNNLLTVILGNLEILESRLGKDGRLQSLASAALMGAQRGAELTQGLLAFSRKQRLETGETDLNGLVLGVQKLFQRTLGKTIIIETDLAEGLWLTAADPGQIEAALLNFVLNARDAMPDGGTITVCTSNLEMTAGKAAGHDGVGPGDYITLEVRDTGTGMTGEQIKHAFEPFYTTKEVGKGTGLGLSVAYGFARQSGGCLEIESELGRGTILRLCLPRAQQSPASLKDPDSRPAVIQA